MSLTLIAYGTDGLSFHETHFVSEIEAELVSVQHCQEDWKSVFRTQYISEHLVIGCSYPYLAGEGRAWSCLKMMGQT